MLRIWVGRVTHMNESRHAYEWVTSRMNESRHTHEWVTSHVWMSHVTHMNASCHTYECVMAHICIHHVTHMNKSCHTYEWVISHIFPEPCRVRSLCLVSVRVSLCNGRAWLSFYDFLPHHTVSSVHTFFVSCLCVMGVHDFRFMTFYHITQWAACTHSFCLVSV